jgi:hypothetical protein
MQSGYAKKGIKKNINMIWAVIQDQITSWCIENMKA